VGNPFPGSTVWTASEGGKRFTWGSVDVPEEDSKSSKVVRLLVSEQEREYPTTVTENGCDQQNTLNITHFYVLTNPYECKLDGFKTPYSGIDHFPPGDSPSEIPSRFYPKINGYFLAMVNVTTDANQHFNATSAGFYSDHHHSDAFSYHSCRPMGQQDREQNITQTSIGAGNGTTTILFVDCLLSIGTMTRTLSNRWRIPESITDLTPEHVILENTTFVNSVKTEQQQEVSYTNFRANKLHILLSTSSSLTQCESTRKEIGMLRNEFALRCIIMHIFLQKAKLEKILITSKG
jgi:hypothetical protein